MKEPASIGQCCIEDLDPVQDLGRLVSYLRSNLVTHLDDALEDKELTSAQYIVVVLLARGKVNTLAELCEHMVYDRGAMSRLLSRLEDKGLVAKKQSVEDRRSTLLCLTEKGQQLYPEILPTVNDIYRKALTGFSDDEQEQLASLLFRAIHNLKA
ncbi:MULTISPECIES: MarR family winged helix-turn-helix transcriptional regulator [Pseudoalteromonas]|uniref:MarR family winged helix-turn-helix transcriptional regulator n=1 Tax=Pseudoalteromonas TaxID=53246 RepID=UPI0006CA36B6|nr:MULTISPECIES: MarR family transcriptional regulator [Pseudoalteromonas]KPM78086.1 MarR family transcriptional regulator [Pseudoalteromonas sp. UCD-33C]KPW02830.1 Organic hydroperoxide resistance transcriptional regulator [Pseudoalteromonas sp. P1-8]KPZ74631.1 Organic hydroperoxide resistance transcriptional regulator [Pseudoalteromonas sp. P1-26]KZY46443.1 MarR family transcriptional regulator [Pseudoalteromonas shioyasakiensis]MCG9733458.1 MarR family transcriptional regulator [Pseudoalter|tara:strand:- start:865 stop:1329 length:465 start_codon:yes stop_codon:yes gene_type:complete